MVRPQGQLLPDGTFGQERFAGQEEQSTITRSTNDLCNGRFWTKEERARRGRNERLNALGLLPAIQIRDEVGALTLGRRNLAGRNQSTAQQTLLVITIQKDHPHDQVLHLPHEKANLRLRRAVRRVQSLPGNAMLPRFVQRFIQSGQQGTPGIGGLVDRTGRIRAEKLGFAFGKAQQFAANRLKPAQVGQHLRNKVHGFDGEAVLVPEVGTGLRRRD